MTDSKLISRRDLLSMGVAVGAVAVTTGCSPSPGRSNTTTPGGEGLPTHESTHQAWGEQWAIEGVANLATEGGTSVLQVGTDVYPSDERASAFVVDRRFKDGRVDALVTATGRAAGVLLRRSSWRSYYFALYEPITGILDIRAKSPDGETVLASEVVGPLQAPVWLSFSASGSHPTTLKAELTNELGLTFSVTAQDDREALQQAGDGGVIATGETLNPEHGTPLGLASGRAIFTHVLVEPLERETIIGEARPLLYTALSTARFEGVQIVVDSNQTENAASDDAFLHTKPSVISATTGVPLHGGATLSAVSDVPAKLSFEVADNEDFSGSLMLDYGPTNEFNAGFLELTNFAFDRRIYWRPVLVRADEKTVGPIRSFRALPKLGSNSSIKMALGTCATEFGPTFAKIADEQPDVFVWHGDLNYPDGAGPLSQNHDGYGAIWKDFLATKQLQPILNNACFAPQRDDHDYGRNDCWSGTLPTFGIDAWENIVNPDIYYSFKGGAIEVWVLDVRRYRDDPELPDDLEKSLVGQEQLSWLMQGLAESTAPFKIICSPTGVFNPPNNMGWGNGYTTERQKLLDHIEANVNGRVVFISGDSHSPAAIEVGPYVEVRTSPLDIPHVGWADPSSGDEVLYSGRGKFYALLNAQGQGADAQLNLQIREVGLLGEGDFESTAWEGNYTPLNLA